jgi:hypothetical protein
MKRYTQRLIAALCWLAIMLAASIYFVGVCATPQIETSRQIKGVNQ